MDPLSDVLSLLRPQGFMAGGFDHAGDWSIQFARHEGIKCYALVSGCCWLAVEGLPETRLQAGDCVLLPRGLPFRIATDLKIPPVDASTYLQAPLHGRVLTWNGGGEFFGIGGHFLLTGIHARALLEELPRVIHIRSEAGGAELRWYLDRMRDELRNQQPGGALVAQQLASMILIQALRLHLAEGPRSGSGWLAALTNKQLSAAIAAMHEQPAHAWTLQALAGCCGMSRSVFALRFKAIVGISPMEYLARWRMMLAEEKLVRSEDSVAAIAATLGYDSESAFSKAFRRVVGSSPRQYRRKEIRAAVG